MLFFGLWRFSQQELETTSQALEKAIAEIKQHVENTQTAEKVNNEYQADINKLNADIKRLRNIPSKCVFVAPTPSVHPKRGQRGGYVGQNGISSQWLYEYAEDAERIRIERNACKNFVNEVWESNN